MNEYQTFEQYFKNLQSSIAGINSIVFLSSWEEIMALQLSSAEYPALIVETPDIEIKNNGGFEMVFDSAMAVIKGVPKDETRTNIAVVQDETLTMMKGLMVEIMCNADADGILDAEIENTINPIIKATADNCYGWRTFFKVSNINLP